MYMHLKIINQDGALERNIFLWIFFIGVTKWLVEAKLWQFICFCYRSSNANLKLTVALRVTLDTNVFTQNLNLKLHPPILSPMYMHLKIINQDGALERNIFLWIFFIGVTKWLVETKLRQFICYCYQSGNANFKLTVALRWVYIGNTFYR